MNRAHFELIQEQYISSTGDYSRLFDVLRSIAAEEGMDRALGYLEMAMIGKRMRWLDRNLKRMKRTGNPVRDGFRIFYELYLGATIPGQGEIVEEKIDRIVSRWWNPCPTLVACSRLGLDTKEICRKAFHKPAQAFLSAIDSRLIFRRNYHSLRPFTPYCEEIIELVEAREGKATDDGSK
jgi:hypothetical protein